MYETEDDVDLATSGIAYIEDANGAPNAGAVGVRLLLLLWRQTLRTEF